MVVKQQDLRKSYIISLEVKIVLYLPQHLVQRQCTFYFAKKIKKNDEVILPAQSHVATAHAIELAGGVYFVDSNSTDGNIDINKIEKISKKL